MGAAMTALSIIGCGFVADLYMRSLATFASIEVIAVYDRDAARLNAFCAYWQLAPAPSLDAFFADQPKGGLVLKLTNPSSHFEINKACLNHGFHVYSEKPLAVTMDEANELHQLATTTGLFLASAPCSVLGEAAQTCAQAIRAGKIGTPRLIYAELDDGYISQAPYQDWVSESGAKWPATDEFQTGCTLEHAGYYLTWLIAMFGSIDRVVAASAAIASETSTPDFSTATLFFESGPVARLTCSIIAPHNHSMQVVGDKGVLRVKQAWHNAAPVRFHRRFTLRRRLVDDPFGRRIKLKGPSHPMVKRKGAAAMNFALGPVEMLEAINTGRSPRLSADFALHLNEVTLAIQNSSDNSGAIKISSRCPLMEPMPWAA